MFSRRPKRIGAHRCDIGRARSSASCLVGPTGKGARAAKSCARFVAGRRRTRIELMESRAVPFLDAPKDHGSVTIMESRQGRLCDEGGPPKPARPGRMDRQYQTGFPGVPRSRIQLRNR